MLAGIGTWGLAISMINAAAVTDMNTDNFGVGTAVLQTVRQTGGILGVSLFFGFFGTPAVTKWLDTFTRLWLWFAILPTLGFVLALGFPAGARTLGPGSTRPASRHRYHQRLQGGPDEACVIHDYEAGRRSRTSPCSIRSPARCWCASRRRASAAPTCTSSMGEASSRTLPMVIGHEGAGVVEAVGAGVDAVAPGDHVVIALYGPCMPVRELPHRRDRPLQRRGAHRQHLRAHGGRIDAPSPGRRHRLPDGRVRFARRVRGGARVDGGPRARRCARST